MATIDVGVDKFNDDYVHTQEAGRRHPGEDGDDQHRGRVHPRHQALVDIKLLSF